MCGWRNTSAKEITIRYDLACPQLTRTRAHGTLTASMLTLPTGTKSGNPTREYFQKWIKSDATVLDLGCGYGEFIRNIDCGRKYGMDLNARARSTYPLSVEFICQDCSQMWPVEDESLDVIFSSNFFEHLPDKRTLSQTLSQAHRCLRPGGTLIAMGPNIKLLCGKYWDFWGPSVPLSEASLAEGLKTICSML